MENKDNVKEPVREPEIQIVEIRRVIPNPVRDLFQIFIREG